MSKKNSSRLLLIILMVILTSCSFSKRQSGDGIDSKDVDITKIPNAIPRDETIHRASSRPYRVSGKRYVPLQSGSDFRQEGYASWYDKKYQGQKTSNGDIYDMYAMTAAHTTLPIPSYARVTNVDNHRSIIVRINDRGPFVDNRVIDLSYVAAKKLGMTAPGSSKVLIEAVSPSSSELDSATLPTTLASPSQSTLQSSPKSQFSSPQVQWFQVGAFSVLNNAETLKVQLLQDGFTSKVVQVASLYKVLVGPVDTSESKGMRQRLERLGYSANIFKE